MNPNISILVPVYNVENYLPQCIDSILGQTYKNLQVVLVDDGSPDSSWDVCKAYVSKDSRVEAYHKENSGVANTRNSLLTKVKGDYMLFVDSDDWIESDMVEALLKIALQYDADVVNCENVINDALCKKVDTSIELLQQEEAIKLFLEHKRLRGSLCNKLIKTSLLHNIRFYRGISLGEDALFCWDILQKANSLVITKQEYYHYRMLDGSLTHSSFGPKKFSAYYVWEKICDDTERQWPQFSDIAKARYCIEMTILLHDAATSCYIYDELIKSLQEIVRDYGHLITKTGLSSWKMRLYGLIGCRFYKLLSLL